MTKERRTAQRLFVGNHNELKYGKDRPIPEHVSIVGLGGSAEAYMDYVKRLGGRHAYSGETWVLNSLGNVLQADLVFHMDDVRIQEIRAAAAPESNIAKMIEGLKEHPGPIMTSRAHEAYPGLVEYPIEDVLNYYGAGYFNNTAPYAVAYAGYIGVKRVTLFGMDYTYPNAHDAERGRACLEYWLGRLHERGMQITIPQNSTLLDTCADFREQFYGYDTLDFTVKKGEDGKFKFDWQLREQLPTAAEIEHRYDHSRHPAEAAINGSCGVSNSIQEVETNSVDDTGINEG